MAKKILVIDDEPLVTKSLARYLKTCDYEVETVNNGEDAIKRAETTLFDLLIADMRMPGLDGIETIKKIRAVCQDKHKARIPEIIITGFASEDSKKEAEDLEVSEYIYKPFDLSTFIEAVKRNIK